MLKKRYDRGVSIPQKVSAAFEDIENCVKQNKQKYQNLEKFGVSEERISEIKSEDLTKSLKHICEDAANVITGKNLEPTFDDAVRIVQKHRHSPLYKDNAELSIGCLEDELNHFKASADVHNMRAKMNQLIDEEKASSWISKAQALMVVASYLSGHGLHQVIQHMLEVSSPTLHEILSYLPPISTFYETVSHSQIAFMLYGTLSDFVLMAMWVLSYKGIEYVAPAVNSAWNDYKDPIKREEWKKLLRQLTIREEQKKFFRRLAAMLH